MDSDKPCLMTVDEIKAVKLATHLPKYIMVEGDKLRDIYAPFSILEIHDNGDGVHINDSFARKFIIVNETKQAPSWATLADNRVTSIHLKNIEDVYIENTEFLTELVVEDCGSIDIEEAFDLRKIHNNNENATLMMSIKSAPLLADSETVQVLSQHPFIVLKMAENYFFDDIRGSAQYLHEQLDKRIETTLENLIMLSEEDDIYDIQKTDLLEQARASQNAVNLIRNVLN